MDPVNDQAQREQDQEWELTDEELDRAQPRANNSTGGGASIVCVYGSASCGFSRP